MWLAVNALSSILALIGRRGLLISGMFCCLLPDIPSAIAQQSGPSDAWTLSEVIRMARAQRTEILAARAGARAANARESLVSALEDPMVMPSIDHYPWTVGNGMQGPPMTGRFDWSVMVEQRFPLSRERSYRRRGAEAETRRLLAESERVVLDIDLQAAEAFFMLSERRRMLVLMATQIALAEQMVSAASARFATGTGSQVDVLRAEVEVARLRGLRQSLVAEERGLQAMFNTSLGRDAGLPVPALAATIEDLEPPAVARVLEAALDARPELQAGTAEIARAAADIDVMRAMYRPMGVLRVGPASSMIQGRGAMVTFGFSVPLWGEKLRAGVAEATAMAQMAQADYHAMRLMIESEAINAREGVAAAREQYLSLRDDVVPRARLAQEPALVAYAAGTGNLTTVVDAAQAQWMAEMELIMAETRLGLAWARLERATGQTREETP